MTETMTNIYDAIKDHFRDHPNVEIAEGKGAQGLKHNGKMFVMFYKGDITVKLKPETVTRLINEGVGLPHDPGTGKPMKDRMLVPSGQMDQWIQLCELSLAEVS